MSVRDDSRLISLVCPYCKMILHMLSPDLKGVTVFRNTKLILLRCTYCEENITENQITDTYRDYHPDDEDEEIDIELDDEWDENMMDDFDDPEDY